MLYEVCRKVQSLLLSGFTSPTSPRRSRSSKEPPVVLASKMLVEIMSTQRWTETHLSLYSLGGCKFDQRSAPREKFLLPGIRV